MCALDSAPGPGSLGSELMACVLLSWYFPLPSFLVSCGIGRAVAAHQRPHPCLPPGRFLSCSVFLCRLQLPRSPAFCSALHTWHCVPAPSSRGRFQPRPGHVT